MAIDAPRIPRQRHVCDASVGIVTLNMNQSEFLIESIKSIQEQNHQDWRLVVVDPGSTDGADSIYELPRVRNDDRIEILRKGDSGPAEGLNNGFQRASDCDLLYYLNADDRLCPGGLDAMVHSFCEHPETDVILGNGWKIDEYGRRVQRVFSDVFDVQDYVDGFCFAVQQATMFRSRVYRAVGAFNEQNRISWDGEFLFDAKRKDLTFRNEASDFGEFRIYGGTITSSPDTVVQSQVILQRLRKSLDEPPRSLWMTVTRRCQRRLRSPRRLAYTVSRKLTALVNHS